MSLNKRGMYKAWSKGFLLLFAFFMLCQAESPVYPKNLRGKTKKSVGKEPIAYKVYGNATTVQDVFKSDQATFYELEKRKFDKIESHAKTAFLKAFWLNEAKKKKTTPKQAEEKYYDEKIKISDQEIDAMIKRVENNPQLKKLSKSELKKQVKSHLRYQAISNLNNQLIEQGKAKGHLTLVYPMPLEPIYDVTLTGSDFVRYGPKNTDTSPKKGSPCDSKEGCPITIVEYSEYQCPFCAKALPGIKRVLKNYEGKIRWAVRDFPLDFHSRAVPAAIAAKCAGFQNKFWEMYEILFQNTSKLEDVDLKKYGSDIGLNRKKYQDCLKNSEKAKNLVAENKNGAFKIGVNGTPAFFINGRKLSGALPYEEFSRVIEEELKKKNRS
tara:strand:- start:1101 stop:2246 length:1146 start_codon:yes stop_codon:yes gene_type:complete